MSVVLQDVKCNNEYSNFKYNTINGSLIAKIVTYNYYAGVWEPLLEKTQLGFEIINDTNDENVSLKTINLNISQYKDRFGMNVNISDITICFLYSTLNSWIEKYYKLSTNYKEEIKNMIDNKTIKITNHTVINHTGRTMIIYRMSKKYNDYVKYKLGIIQKDKCFDIEYFDDENDVADRKGDITQNLVKENYISFEFEDITNNKISDNSINIDKVQLKTHKINYVDIIRKYKTNININSLEYVISEVKYHELRKYVYFYSPLTFKNKTRRCIYIRMNRKELPVLNSFVKPKDNFGVPYEYMDGMIEFSLDENFTYSRSSEVKIFLLSSFSSTEYKINDVYINLMTDSFQNKKKNAIMVIISSSYILRNCLPFDINMQVYYENCRKYTSYVIPKSERTYIDNLAYNDNLIVNMSFLTFTNKTEPITLFSIKDFNKALSKKEKEKDASTGYVYNSSFNLYDSNSLPLKLFIALVDNNDSRVIAIYSNSVIVNNTMMNLKYFYSSKKDNKYFEIAGQKDNSSKNNVLLHSDEKYILFQLNNPGRVGNVLSDIVPINAIGISNVVSLKKNDINYEFILNTKLSLVAKDLELYSTMVVIAPRFVIFNNLGVSVLICQYKGNNVPESILPLEKKPYYFCGMGADSPVCFRPIEEDKILEFHSGSKWNWSLPISLISCGLMTVQISGIKSYEKKYINIEKQIEENTTFVILNEADYTNAQFVIENYSHYISMKIFQENFDKYPEYVNINSRSMYAWSDYNETKIMNIEFLIGNITSRPLCPIKNNSKKYEILDDKIYIDKTPFVYPASEVINISKDKYTGYYIKMEILTDGMKKTIKFSDHKLMKDFDRKLTNLNSSNEKLQMTEINVKIDKLGISLITDNKNINKRNNYYRNELVYITLRDLHYYNKMQIDQNQASVTEMQMKIKSLQVDNEFTYVTHYPVIMKYIENTGNYQPPFFNLCYTSYRGSANETTKIGLLNYLIQMFVLQLDSETIESFLNFISNVTIQLKTSLTQVNPIFESREENKIIKIFIYEDQCEPGWLGRRIITNQSDKLFIQALESSSIEIILSFNVANSKVIQKYITTNPFLSSLLSTISNIDKARIFLSGHNLFNFYGNMNDLFELLVSHYKQSAIRQVLKLVGSIELLGNPSNVIKNFGTGFEDFIKKPIEGIIKGPLEGVKGAIEGSLSLFKHTAFGTFSATSKITGGLSKGLVSLTQDDKYLRQLETKRMTERPANVVEGIGHGIIAMAEGVFTGITDVVTKPVEGTKKEGAKGFIKGLFKGVGGLLTKPIVGGLEFVSRASEGLKNSIVDDKLLMTQERKPRAFYGKFKSIRSYNSFHAYVVDFIKNKMDSFKNITYDFYGSEMYYNHKGELIFLLMTTNSVYFIDSARREIRAVLRYSEINSIQQESPSKIKIMFKTETNGKNYSAIFLSDKDPNGGFIYNKLKEAVDDNSENI